MSYVFVVVVYPARLVAAFSAEVAARTYVKNNYTEDQLKGIRIVKLRIRGEFMKLTESQLKKILKEELDMSKYKNVDGHKMVPKGSSEAKSPDHPMRDLFTKTAQNMYTFEQFKRIIDQWIHEASRSQIPANRFR